MLADLLRFLFTAHTLAADASSGLTVATLVGAIAALFGFIVYLVKLILGRYDKLVEQRGAEDRAQLEAIVRIASATQTALTAAVDTLREIKGDHAESKANDQRMIALLESIDRAGRGQR